MDVVELSSGVAAIETGDAYSCALMTYGGVKCWGNNNNGQLGTDNTSSTSTPTDVVNLDNAIGISAEYGHTCALTDQGGAKCWGSGLGVGTDEPGYEGGELWVSPVDVQGLGSGVSSIKVGRHHTCALLASSGGMKCWGNNYYGQLGNGTTTNSQYPISVANLPEIITVPISPREWVMTMSLRPTLRWTAVPGIDKYKLLINNDVAINMPPRIKISKTLILSSSEYCSETICEFKPLSPDDEDPLGFELVSSSHGTSTNDGVTDQMGMYTWGAIPVDDNLTPIGQALPAYFQIPSLDGTWDRIKDEGFCLHAPCKWYEGDFLDNPYWNQYDNMIYRYAERWDVPPQLLKAMMVGETNSALGPYFVGSSMTPFPPTRVYGYEPKLDCHYYVNRTPGSLIDSNVYDIADYSQQFDGGGFNLPGTMPYNLTQNDYLNHWTIWEFYDTFKISPPVFSGNTIPGVSCDVNSNAAQFRTSASYGPGQQVYLYEFERWGPKLVEEVMPPITGNYPPPEELYQPDAAIFVMGFTLNQKRCALAPGVSASNNLNDWIAPANGYYGDLYSRYGTTAADRASSMTAPYPSIFTTINADEIYFEDTNPMCDPESLGFTPISVDEPDILTYQLKNHFSPKIMEQLTDPEMRLLTSQMVDMKGDLGVIRVDLVVQDSPFTTGFVQIFRDAEGNDLLWQSAPITNVNSVGWIETTEVDDSPIILTNWGVGAHGMIVYPIAANGLLFQFIPAFDPNNNLVRIFGNAGGITTFSDGYLATYLTDYEGPQGTNFSVVWALEDSEFHAIQTVGYTDDYINYDPASPPSTSLLIQELANNNGWWNSDVHLELIALDNSSVNHIAYTLENGSGEEEKTIPMDNVSLVLNEGFWRLSYYSVDMGGNTETPKYFEIFIDDTPPETCYLIINPGGVPDDPPCSEGIQTSDKYSSLQINANDPTLDDGSEGSGIDYIQYSLDNGFTWIEYEGEISFSDWEYGLNVVQYRSVDLAGNWSDIKSVEILIVISDTWMDDILRISVPSSGGEGNEPSYYPSISDEGRFIVFESYASNLIDGDSNGFSDIFLFDREFGTISRISVSPNGSDADCDSNAPNISGNGRFIVYESCASNLIPDFNNPSNSTNIYIYDRELDETELVSLAIDGLGGNDSSYLADISADGLYVVYTSFASNLVLADANGFEDIFLRDRVANITIKISTSFSGIDSNGESLNSAISADGRYIAFDTLATNLIDGDPVGGIYRWDRIADEIIHVSVSDNGQSIGYGEDPSISGDGNLIAFSSSSNDFISGDISGYSDIFVRNVTAETTIRVSIGGNNTEANNDSYESQISTNGRYVVFSSLADNLVEGDGNGTTDIFRYDLWSGEMIRIPRPNTLSEGNYFSYQPAVSADGNVIVFASAATNLVLGDENNSDDVFVYWLTGTIDPLTLTPTTTSTETPTPTPTETITPAPTSTETPTPTQTKTDISTDTPTEILTPTPTETDTPTNSPIDTPTLTPTETNTSTYTPTDTPTPTPT